MRILQLTRDYPPLSKGGISTAVGGMVRGLGQQGVPCAVISFDGWRPRSRTAAQVPEPTAAEQDGVPVLRIQAPDQLPVAERFAHDVEPTHLHVHHEMLWDFAQRLLAQRRVGALFTVHVLQSKLDALRGLALPTLSSQAQVLALQQADCVLAPSPAVEQLLLKQDPSLAARLRVVGLGIEDNEQARRSVARRASNTTPSTEAAHLLYVGRFADVNGITELFQLLSLLAGRLPDARFTLAGGVPGNPRGERRWLRRWQREASAQAIARTCFVGWVDPAELAGLYDAADALVSPSWFETFGLTVLEAMLYGVPIAATRSGGVQQLLRDHENGLLSPVGDLAQLADNLTELLGDRNLARSLGTTAAGDARARWLWSQVVPELVAAYEHAETHVAV